MNEKIKSLEMCIDNCNYKIDNLFRCMTEYYEEEERFIRNEINELINEREIYEERIENIKRKMK